MLDKENLLKDIYRYYSKYPNKSNNKKEDLRKRKIRDKDIVKEEICKSISDITKGYAILDWTDSDSCCLEYKVLLHRGQDILDDDIMLIKLLHGIRNDLRVFVSILEPYYFMFLEQTQYSAQDKKWIFNTINLRDKEIIYLVAKLDTYFAAKGYTSLSDKDVKITVPNVQTEFKDLKNVNVFDCLFTDLVNIY